jgi:glycosyltransferase involved in cell wall biosynthesis
MKYIHILPAISNEASGPSYSVTRLCETLIGSGKNVSLATLEWNSQFLTQSYVYRFPLSYGPRRLGRSTELEKWLIDEAKAGDLSLLHNHGMWQMNAIYPGKIAKKYNIPLIVSPRGTMSSWAMNSGSYFKKIFWYLLQKPSIKSAVCFHATAFHEYNDIRRLGFQQPIAIIPNGVDIPFTFEKKIKENNTLLFLGRINPVKGIDLLLRAWKTLQVRFPNWKLLIVGDDAGYYSSSGYLAKMKSLATDLALRRVEFYGPLYGEAKWKTYFEAELFVLPTYSENFGMSVAEALASGTPSIVSKGAPWSDLEIHGAGSWVEIGLDPLINALEINMSHSPELLREMGARGREWMIRDYSWAKIGNQMSAVYEWVTDTSKTIPTCLKLN